MSHEKKVHSDAQHLIRFRKTFTAAIESCKVVTDAAVGTFDEMRLRFGHDVTFRNLHNRKRGVVA